MKEIEVKVSVKCNGKDYTISTKDWHYDNVESELCYIGKKILNSIYRDLGKKVVPYMEDYGYHDEED